jgi:trehalose 6-phosphate phosphatase
MTRDNLDPDLVAALVAVAGVGTLLIASDVDGTISPIVAHPADAVVEPAARTVLAELASLPDTPVALVSGRALIELKAMTDLGPMVLLVGSHGAEHGDYVAVTPTKALALEQVLREVRAIADGVPGVLVEEKATGVAVHVRRASRDDAERVTAEVVAGPSTRPGVRTTYGKEVVELSVVDADKGRALDRLREEVSADAVVFLGDDVTDETAFARLTPTDVGIKVGPGDTAAGFRVATTDDVTTVLTTLARARAQRSLPDL